MLRIGITGQSGFIGTHLLNTLSLCPDKYSIVPFTREYFSIKAKLNSFVSRCDIIVHLAALTRHNPPELIYQQNIALVDGLIQATEQTNSSPCIIFASSIQEESASIYGKSKRVGRELFEKWAIKNNASFTSLIIPNVFGPFGDVHFNSVIATFCHQLTHIETPKIDIDGEMKLIYVAELIKEIIELVNQVSSQKPSVKMITVPHTSQIKVSELLKILTEFKTGYFEKGEIPAIDQLFQRNLFNTFLTYIDHTSFFPFLLKSHPDQRGNFTEIAKFNSGGQVCFSTTVPGKTRGNHFHTRKAERFIIIKGKAIVQLRRIGTSNVLNFEFSSDQLAFIDIPIWFTHNITNIGDEDLYTIFRVNEFFDSSDPDIYFQDVICS